MLSCEHKNITMLLVGEESVGGAEDVKKFSSAEIKVAAVKSQDWDARMELNRKRTQGKV